MHTIADVFFQGICRNTPDQPDVPWRRPLFRLTRLILNSRVVKDTPRGGCSSLYAIIPGKVGLLGRN